MEFHLKVSLELLGCLGCVLRGEEKVGVLPLLLGVSVLSENVEVSSREPSERRRMKW